MKTQSLSGTEIVSTDRNAFSIAEMRPIHHGFYHGVIGMIVMGLLLTSCASSLAKLDTASSVAPAERSEVSSEGTPRAVQIDEVQVWNPIDRSQFFSARNR